MLYNITNMETNEQIAIHYSSFHKPNVSYDQDGNPHILIYEEFGYETLSVEKDPKTQGTNVIIRRLI